jgi:uncharacterized membrane protein
LKTHLEKYSFFSVSFSAWAVLLFFAVIYALISFVNHYSFRTYTLDLGFYTNALYDYRLLRWNDSTTIFEKGTNMLGGHFEPLLFLFAPFSWVFGTYTLLVIQVVFLLLGGYGVYTLFEKSGRQIALGALIFFLGYFTLFAALAFDFHTNVIAASVFPFLVLGVRKNKPLGFAFAFIFMLLCKENVGLWLVFVLSGLAFEERKNKVWRCRLWLASAFSALYFASVIFWIIPSFSDSGAYGGFLYSVVGDTPLEALTYVVTHPLETLKLLFVNHSGLELANFYKIEFHLLVLCTGLPLLLWRPAYFFMLIPLYFQKMLHNDPSMWGVGFHYGAEFAPVTAIGIFSAVRDFPSEKWQKIACVILPFLSLAVTFRSMDSTEMFTDKSRIRFYQKGHYTRKYKVAPVHHLLGKIPADAVVSAQSPFLPHLALRNFIYQFPIVKDAEFIVFSKREVTYPLTREEFENLTDLYLNDTENWEIWEQADGFYILKKRR